METLVINLNDSTDRLNTISSELKQHHLDFTRIEAVDGRNVPAESFPEYNSYNSKRRHNKSLSGGEVACYLSHVLALRHFLESGDRLCLILEDDANTVEKFGDQLSELSNLLDDLDKWDVINLTERRDSWMRPIKRTSENELRRAFYFPMLTTGNLWSREGASAFMNSHYGRSVSGPIDTELRSFCAKRGKGLSLKTPIIRPSGAPSDIDGHSARNPSGSRTSSRRTLTSAMNRHWPDHIRAAFNYLTTRA